MIPKKIFTFWFSEDGSIPEEIKQYVDSQKIEGYEHRLITLFNCYRGTQYILDCISSPHKKQKWVKLTDRLKLHYLYEYGGIVMDADVEVLKSKNFDSLLDEKMFIGKEVNGKDGEVVLGMAVLGGEKGHPFVKRLIDEMEGSFKGNDTVCYEASMQLLNIIGVEYQHLFTLLEPEVLYPYEWLHTGKTNITENTIGIHHFLRTWIPETNKKSTLQQFKYNIENNINFTFVKRGDGELACMNGESGGNCDGHPYSKELGDKLGEAYEYLKDKATIVEFDDQENYNVLLHRTDSNLKEVSEFYKAIANSERRKVLVAPERLAPVAALLNAEHIVIPEVNAFQFFDGLFHSIPIYPFGVYLFCAGMPAKGWISRMVKINSLATYLDCGSAFDPSCYQSRTEQISKDEFWNLYKKEEPVNNFLLPQETHPERVWVLQQLIPSTREIEKRVMYDLGAGTHKTLPEVVGVDIRPVTDVCSSIDSLPFEQDSAHVIISRHSLEHILDPVKTLREWMRVLKPSGKMVIVLPDHEFINTIDPYYSNGEHLHAYTRESFKNLISLFPDLHISKQETVLKDWSFGTVIYKLPKISFILPQLGREEGLKKCLQSIEDLDYPTHLKEITVIEGEETVPEKVAEGLKQSTGEYICYCANDMFFFPDTIRTAVIESLELNKGLVSFNEGELLPDLGNVNTHFLLRKSLIENLENGQIFSTAFHHSGSDNFLWKQCERMNEAHHSEKAKIVHNHFSKGGTFDEIYEKGWSKVEQDRNVLKEKLLTLNGNH